MFKVTYLFKRMFCMDILTSFSCITLQQDDVWIEVSNPEVFFQILSYGCRVQSYHFEGKPHVEKNFFFLIRNFHGIFHQKSCFLDQSVNNQISE